MEAIEMLAGHLALKKVFPNGPSGKFLTIK